MRPTGPEVSDVFRTVIPRLPKLNLSPERYRIFRAIVSCRTALCDGHVGHCKECGYREQSYNSCWNRHCPKCRGGSVFEWVSDRVNDLLPVPYFHLVFTLPHELNDLVHANKAALYDVLFASSSDTILDVGKKNLSLTLGFFGVLHTWNQELQYHPHIHFLVPGGGLHTETNRWHAVPGGAKFFLPVRILGEVFRGKFVERLKAVYKSRKLYIPKQLSHLENPKDFEHFVSRATSKRWVVYAKRPFAGPERVVKYLASYTHRVGISNSRIQAVDSAQVTFVARDRNDPSKRRPVTLSNETFVRRFLQHAVPKGFRRIRYYGFMAVHLKEKIINQIREQLSVAAPPPMETVESLAPLTSCCPSCGGYAWVAEVRKPHSRRKSPLRTEDLSPRASSP